MTPAQVEEAHRILEAAAACVVCEGPHDRRRHPARVMTGEEHGERIRTNEHIARLRSLIDGFEIAMKDPGSPPGPGEAQSVVDAAVGLAMAASRLWAYHRAAPSSKRHTTNEHGDCVDWCGACRHNVSRGLNPDGSVR